MTAEKERSRSELIRAEKNTLARIALQTIVLLIAFAALLAFSVVLAKLTLTPSPASVGVAGSNLRPGHSLRQYADDYTFLAACKQIGGNLLLGAPFGLILPVLVLGRMRMVKVVLLTAAVMMLIELVQGALVAGRAFDIDDVILNTSGALFAYVVVGRRIGRHYHALGLPPRRKRTDRKSAATAPPRCTGPRGRLPGRVRMAWLRGGRFCLRRPGKR